LLSKKGVFMPDFSPASDDPRREEVAEVPREHLERLSLALKSAGVGTWSWNAGNDLMRWDEHTGSLFGMSSDRLSGSSDLFLKLFHPEDRRRFMREVLTAASREGLCRIECRVIWPTDGSEHVLRIKGMAQKGAEGRLERVAGACWDITERRKTEEELEHERFLLRSLMENITDNIYFKDRESRFIRVNKAMASWFGMENPADFIGKTDFDLFSEEHARKAFEDEQEIIRTGQAVVNQEEKETWRGREETWVTTTKMPLQDSGGRIIGSFGLSRDITSRKKTEGQLARYAEELRQKNADLEEDLEMARELQSALLPQEYPRFPRSATDAQNALRFSHFYNPSMAVSGDFFDILQLSDTMAGMFICDVMGHGVRAALVAAIVRTLVEEFHSLGENPGAFLDEVNRSLLGILRPTRASRSPVFASAFYLVADLKTGELRYANAGHPRPLCVRHGEGTGKGEVFALNGAKCGPVLGIFDGPEYATGTCRLMPKDSVLLFTDGLFEVEGAGGEFYDQPRLLGAVKSRANLPARDICTAVLDEIQQFSASREFSDDVCLVAMEVERLGLTA
jgi:sigma-B regulation protein RsbU (phosphoserine phosphatase)